MRDYYHDQQRQSRNQAFSKGVMLDEKYFRRVDKFDGDLSKFRGWLFDFLVAIGQVDHYLVIEIKKLLARGLDEKWDPEADVMMDKELHQKYSS